MDPRSEKVALYYTGSDPDREYVPGVPARDLTEADIARQLYIRHGGKALSGAAESNASAALLDELAAGPYRRTKPESPAKSAPDEKPAKSTPAGPGKSEE